VDTVYVHYPFHPLHGRELRVFVPARSADGAVTVEDAAQKRLKIPLWMVAAEAARFEVTDTPTIEGQALLRLVELCELHRGKFSVPELHPTTEPSHAATLVDQATARERIDADAGIRFANAF
jgi:hypothetical protein